MNLARRGWWLVALAACALAGVLEASGRLQGLGHAAADARSRALLRTVDSRIVVVGIDAQSLAALDRWPWPRRHHAALIDRLAEARPARLFLDIDFSSRSNELDDAVLESALARWPGEPVLLPAFFQPRTSADATPVVTRPLPRFERHARLVAVNRRPAQDGLERRWRAGWSAGGLALPSVIDPEGRLGPATEVPIDYSISPASFEYVSYVELLEGRVPAATLRDRTVYVGATAIELGDMVPVPLHRSLPGVVVQAIATESLQPAPIARPPAWAGAVALAAWSLLCAAVMRARAWRRNALALAGAFVALAAASLWAYASLRVALDVVPPAVATVAVFLIVTLRSLDQQTWRAVTYALGMKRRDALLKSIVHSSTDCIVCVDAGGTIRTANPAAGRLFDSGATELVGQPIGRFIPGLAGGAATPPFTALDGGVSEWDARTAAGRALPVELALGRVRLHGERLYTAIVRDISERKTQERRLRHQATHDSLTLLPNRAALMQRLEMALSTVQAPRPLALLMLDLCRFKEVNDTLGHHVGDQVLAEVARRFRATLGERGLIARLGGDEFAAVVEDAGEPAVAAAVARAMQDALLSPIEVAGVSIEVGLSIGIARLPTDAADARTLLKLADVAMYLSKRRGTAFEFYDAAQDHHSVRKLRLASELRAAIAGDGLALHFQPQVDLASGRATGVEALLRWPHPEFGPVNPAEFVAIAESTDMIRPLTEWTLRTALAASADWRRRGIAVRVAANLSARLLQDVGFPARLRALLEGTDVPASDLELEITESAMMLDPERALRVVRDLHGLGVRIAIDDFGTGYCSLGYLRDLPVHALKLDKSFVMGMRGNADDRVIVETAVQLAHALGLEIVAEGVESEWDADFLRSAGYDVGQGYRYSAALAPADCAAWIAANHAEADARPRRDLQRRGGPAPPGRRRA